jgi:putative redox protein
MNEIKRVTLHWTGEGLAFQGGGTTHPAITVDGGSRAGPSPMEVLLLSVAGCMAIDVRLILDKARVPLTALEVETEGVRADTEPRRYIRVKMIFRVTGPTEEHEARVARAVQLSRDKYCSVLHTLDPDLPIETSIERI